MPSWVRGGGGGAITIWACAFFGGAQGDTCNCAFYVMWSEMERRPVSIVFRPWIAHTPEPSATNLGCQPDTENDNEHFLSFPTPGSKLAQSRLYEYVLEAVVIVFLVLELSAPRLKARPLRHPVGYGLENGKWRRPEMSRILRQIVIMAVVGTLKTHVNSVPWKWPQPALVSRTWIDKNRFFGKRPHIGGQFSWCNIFESKFCGVLNVSAHNGASY